MLPVLLLACAHRPPVAPPLAPATWSLRAADAQLDPPQLSELLKQYFDVHILVASSVAPDGGVDLLFAPSSDGSSQDRCGPTTQWAGLARSPEGDFAHNGAQVDLRTEGLAYRLDLASFQGRLTSEGLRASEISGLLDTRALAGMLDETNPMSICGMLGAMIPCLPCPEDGVAACWELQLEGADFQPSALTLEPRSHEDIAADPACGG